MKYVNCIFANLDISINVTLTCDQHKKGIQYVFTHMKMYVSYKRIELHNGIKTYEYYNINIIKY